MIVLHTRSIGQAGHHDHRESIARRCCGQGHRSRVDGLNETGISPPKTASIGACHGGPCPGHGQQERRSRRASLDVSQVQSLWLVCIVACVRCRSMWCMRLWGSAYSTQVGAHCPYATCFHRCGCCGCSLSSTRNRGTSGPGKTHRHCTTRA